MEVNVNTLRVVTGEWYARPDTQGRPSTTFLGYTGKTPWLERKVYIASPGDPHNKEQAVVKDVILAAPGTVEVIRKQLPNEKPFDIECKNGIKIVVQFTRIRPDVLPPVKTYHYEELLDWE